MNFYDYIKNDIEEKKALFDVLPHNTELRKKKFLDILNETKETYLSHKNNVENFLNYKNEKLTPVETVRDTSLLDKNITYYKDVLRLSSTISSSYEKLGIDMIFDDFLNYSKFPLNDINAKLEKTIIMLGIAKIKVNEDYFRTNVYAYAYMHNFFDIYYNKQVKPKSDSFESIYWACPKVIEYIFIDLWIIIRDNKKKLDKYSNRLYEEKFKPLGLKSIDDVYNFLMQFILQKEKILDEDEADIVKLFVEGKLDITTYLKDSDIRKSDYNYFMINPVNLDNKQDSDDFYNSIINMRHNFDEYNSYLGNLPLIDYFKDKYKEVVEISADKKKEKETLKNRGKEYKEKNLNIEKLIKDLYKYKCKYNFGSKDMKFIVESRSKEDLFNQEQILGEIYKVFYEYLDYYYDSIVKNTLRFNSSIVEIYKLVYYYPYFGKKIIKKVFELENEEDIDAKYYELEEFLYNPYKKILDMIPIFVEKDIPTQLANGFRFENINIISDSFTEENMPIIFDKSLKLLRCRKLDSFKLSIDEIVFLSDYKKLKDEELI